MLTSAGNTVAWLVHHIHRPQHPRHHALLRLPRGLVKALPAPPPQHLPRLRHHRLFDGGGGPARLRELGVGSVGQVQVGLRCLPLPDAVDGIPWLPGSYCKLAGLPSMQVGRVPARRPMLLEHTQVRRIAWRVVCTERCNRKSCASAPRITTAQGSK
jgi:hypothetical protein